jgi:hypothetical protein
MLLFASNRAVLTARITCDKEKRMIRKIGTLAAAAILAASLGVTGGAGVISGVTHVHAAQGGDAGVSQFCQEGGRQFVSTFVLPSTAPIPVSQGACVSFIQSALINEHNEKGHFGSAIGASLCQTLEPNDQGACVTSFNAFFKGGNG